VCPEAGAGDQVDRGGCQYYAAWTFQVEPPLTDPETGEEATRHTCGFRRKLIRLLKDGSEYFTPKEVPRIVRAARIGAKGSLNAINMLEEDMRHFESVFPKASKRKLREQCRDTVLEYEESMRVWKEMKDTGDLCTSDTNSEEEDELTGEELLRTFDKASAAADPAGAPKADSSGNDWP
jgi:hypothetical protein